MIHRLLLLRSYILSFENGLIFFLVLAMLSLSVTQILLRNLFDFGIVWAETLTRIMVLWLAMIGSMVAARSSKHLSIDLVDRFCKGRFRDYMLGLTQLLTAFICLIMAYYSMNFLTLEFYDGTEAFADLPSWIFISIIPFAFLVMGIRYLANTVLYAIGVTK